MGLRVLSVATCRCRSTPRRTCSHTSAKARILAVAAWIAATLLNEDKTTIFGQLLTANNAVGPSTKWPRFLSLTWKRFCETGDVNDAPRSGRPADIELPHVEEAANILEKGYIHNGRQCWYVNVEEAAKFCPAMAEVLRKADCTPKKMWKAVQRHRPNLVKKTIHVRPPFSQQLRFERLLAAEKCLYLTEEELMRIVFIDEKTLYVRPRKAVECICPKDTVLPICEDFRLVNKGKKAAIKIKCIFAVSPTIGAVLWRPLSGSDGYTTRYKVSRSQAVSSLPSLPTKCVLSCFICIMSC